MISSRPLFLFTAVWAFCVLASCDQRSGFDAEPDGNVDPASRLVQIAKLEGDVSFTLEDGEALNEKNPESFWIPSRKRRENLVEDDLVKLVFNLTDGKRSQGERMWVIVTGGDSGGYTGILDNDPYSTDEIQSGLEVSFEPRHVIDIFEDESAKTDEPEQVEADKP